MKVVIAGSRDITDSAILEKAIAESGFTITKLVCGMARGADMLGYAWALANRVPIEEYPANWNKYGKSAGMKRNREMAKIAEAAIILWDGISPGTKMMIDECRKRDIPVHLVVV